MVEVKEPKDLGIKVETKRGAKLVKAIEAIEDTILTTELSLELDKENLISLKAKLEKEREKFK